MAFHHAPAELTVWWDEARSTAGLVEEERDGRWAYYRLRDAKHPFFNNIRCCIEAVCCCADIQVDLRRLRTLLKLRRGGRCVVGFRR